MLHICAFLFYWFDQTELILIGLSDKGHVKCSRCAGIFEKYYTHIVTYKAIFSLDTVAYIFSCMYICLLVAVGVVDRVQNLRRGAVQDQQVRFGDNRFMHI